MEKWITTRTRYAPCYWPFQTYFGWDVKNFWGLVSTPRCIHYWQKGHFTAYIDQATTFEIGNLLIERLKKTDLSLLRQTGKKSGFEVVNKIKKSALDCVKSGINIDKVIKHLKMVAKLYPIIERDNMHYWLHLEFVLEPLIRSKLSHLDASDVEQIFKNMTIVEEKSYSAIEEESFYKIVELAAGRSLEDAQVKNLIEKFSNRYIWFPYEYAGPKFWDIETVTARVKESLSKPALDLHHDQSDIVKELTICIQKYQLTDEVAHFFEIIRTMSLMQDDRKAMNSEICYYTNGLVLKKLAESMDISDQLILYADIDLLTLAKTDQKSFIANLEERSRSYAIIQIDNIMEIATGSKIEEKFKELGVPYTHDYSGIVEIKGSIGYRGIVRGEVRLLNNSHVDDFNDGDIIVTGMTTPDFVPLIKKPVLLLPTKEE
ncbi:MAG: hypothetical protein AAB969_03355 [Patescibacteria group bacterium]